MSHIHRSDDLGAGSHLDTGERSYITGTGLAYNTGDTAMTATPDYASLSRRLGALVYHIQQTGTADSQDAQTCFEAAEALRTLLERNAALMRERTNLIETKREQIDRLQKERDEQQKRADMYKRALDRCLARNVGGDQP